MNGALLHSLSIEEIEQSARNFKDDLTRECKRLIRRGDHAGALSAIHAEEYIDQFVYNLKTLAGSQICAAAIAARAARPARAKPIRLPGHGSLSLTAAKKGVA